jgi:hypothetical protein
MMRASTLIDAFGLGFSNALKLTFAPPSLSIGRLNLTASQQA